MIFNRVIPLALALALSAGAQGVPFEWDAEASVALAATKDVYRGETVSLRPGWLNYGAEADTNGWTFTLCWQTNGMGSAWWTDATNAFLWTPERDCGAPRYTLFIRAASPFGVSYRANAVFRMLASPGFTSAELPPPSCYPTLASDILAMLIPSLPTYDAWIGESALRISGDAAGSNNVEQVRTGLQAQIDALGSGASSASANTAWTLAAMNGEWLVGIEPTGTATLWRVTQGTGIWTATVPELGATFEIPGLPYPPETFEYSMPVYPFLFFHCEGNGSDIYEIWISGGSGMWARYDIQASAEIELSDRSQGAEQSAWLRYSAVVSTNAVGSYVTSAALAQAVSNALAQAGDSAAATNALAISTNAFAFASNAWLRAGTALSAAQAADARITAATNAIVRTYLISSNAWLTANWSNQTLSVSLVLTNGNTNVVLVGSSQNSIDPAATNMIWLALASANASIAGKAPKAWGQFAPDGTPNPEPDYQLWLNTPTITFAAGYQWQSYGMYAAVVSTGMVAMATGSNGMWRIAVDSTNYLGVVQGGSVMVGSIAGSLAVTDGGATNGWAEISYDYAGGEFPTLQFSATLAGGGVWTEVLTAEWTDNLDGTATVVAPAAVVAGFWRAMTSREYDYTLESTMPFAPRGGVVGATNATPVVYDSTITVTSGGHTYRIPAQLEN
jgi:hypothetical protein